MNQTESKKLPVKSLLLTLAAVIVFAVIGSAFLFLQPPYKANVDLAVIPAQFNVDGNPSEWVVAPFKIVNNTDAELDLEVDVKLPEGWAMVGKLPRVVLAPEKSDDLFVTATIPSGTESGKYPINFSAISKGNGELFDTDKTYVNIRSVAIPRVKVGDNRLDGKPTETLNFEVELINDGNTEQNFQLSLSETPTGWRTRISETSIKVSNGQSKIIIVSIDIPFGAPETLHTMKFHAKNGDFEDTADLHVEVVQQN